MSYFGQWDREAEGGDRDWQQLTHRTHLRARRPVYYSPSSLQFFHGQKEYKLFKAALKPSSPLKSPVGGHLAGSLGGVYGS